MKLYELLYAGLTSCAFIGAIPAAAQEATPWQVIVQWDNDLLTGSDRDYTNGARLAFVREFEKDEPIHNFLQKSLYALSGADEGSPFHELRLPNGSDLRFAYGVGLTQLMFTPENPIAPTAPNGERPYAAWLGMEFSLHTKSSEAVSSVTLSLGTTSKYSFGEETQEWVHRNISDSMVYQGWNSQVPAEFTATLHFDHKRRIRFLDDTNDWLIEMDGYYEWGGALGNFRTDAYFGSLLRAGYNLPATYSTPRVQFGSYGHALFRAIDPKEAPFSILTFAGIRGSAVLHDISLDGPVFRDFNTGVDSKPFVGELLFGIGLRYGYYGISFSRTLRSKEFKGQNDSQEFGSVMFRFNKPF